MSLLSPTTAGGARADVDNQPPDLISALQENADLWKRVRNLQERDHHMCAEIVDLRRQLNNLRMTRHATSPSSAISFTWPPAKGAAAPAASSEAVKENTELRRENEELRHTITRLRAEASDAADMRDRIRALQKEVEYLRDREHGYLPSPSRETQSQPLRDPLRESLRDPLRERERERDELGPWRTSPSSHSRSSSRELHHPYARPQAKMAAPAALDPYHDRILQHDWEHHSAPGIVGSRMRPII